MPFNGSGVYAAPSSSFNPAVSGQNADPTDWNTFLADISTALSTCILRNGNGVPTTDIPWGGYKITNYGSGSAPSAKTDVPNVGQVQNGQFTWAGTAGGTKNALTLTPTPAITAYATGQKFRFISGGSASDDAVTIDISSVGTKAIQYAGSAMSASNVIAASKIYEITYDGTQFQISKAIAVASLVSSDIGVTVQGYDADTVKSDATATFTAGYSATPYNAGTKSSGTYTPDEANGNFQYAVNGGAHTLAPPTNNCTIIVQYTNNASAGAITTSGFTKKSGSFTTTDGDDFFCYITKLNGFSSLTIEALQ